MPMIDCTTCRHWDVFEWRATLSARLTEGGFKDTPIHEHVETCKIGRSPVESGKTVTSQLEACKGFKEKE